MMTVVSHSNELIFMMKYLLIHIFITSHNLYINGEQNRTLWNSKVCVVDNGGDFVQ